MKRAEGSARPVNARKPTERDPLGVELKARQLIAELAGCNLLAQKLKGES